MPEHVQAWWERRRFSKGATTPYEIGLFRDAWRQYPVLVRQYHPDLNFGLTLSQIPPAADVFLLWQCEAGHQFVATPWEQRQRPGRSRRRSSWCPECAAGATARPARQRPAAKPLCAKTPDVMPGTAFASECAPRVASAAEASLRHKLESTLQFTPGLNAVRTRQSFFTHLEVWPDIIIDELRVAIEYDTTGRDGLEHVGRREKTDKRKDTLLRQSGWEVIRVRTGKLQAIGEFDVEASTISRVLVLKLLDRLREIRGSLIVDCYLR